MQHIAYKLFNIIFKIFFFWGGAQNLTLPPGASYPRYATVPGTNCINIITLSLNNYCIFRCIIHDRNLESLIITQTYLEPNWTRGASILPL